MYPLIHIFTDSASLRPVLYIRGNPSLACLLADPFTHSQTGLLAHSLTHSTTQQINHPHPYLLITTELYVELFVCRSWLILLLVHSMLPHLGTIAIAPFIHALAVDKKLPFEDTISSGTAEPNQSMINQEKTQSNTNINYQIDLHEYI